MNQFDEEYLNHLKKVLQEHEEPYVPGAWERFQSQQQPVPVIGRKRFGIRQWMTAAAAVLAFAFLFAKIYSSLHTETPNPTPVIAEKNNTPTTLPNKDPLATEDNGLAAVTSGPGAPVLPGGAVSSTDLQTAPPATPFYGQPDDGTHFSWKRPQQIVANQRPLNLNGNIPGPELPAAAAPAVAATPQVDFWKSRIVENQPEKAEKPLPNPGVNLVAAAVSEQKSTSRDRPKRWQSSLYVSPVFGDLGVSMGYGYSLGFAVNDKLKISSGIAHTKISGSRSFEPGPSPAATAALASARPAAINTAKTASFAPNAVAAPQQTTTIQQIDATLSGIDIPLELNYSINKKFYVAGGISGLIVIKDRKTYTMLDSRDVKVSVETNDGRIKEDKDVTFHNSITSSDPETVPNETVPFLGFYNLSVGFRQKITNKNAVSLEPFVKIPVKNVTQQQLNYSGVGVRLKFDF